MDKQHYVPGMRVEIRDAEWRIQRLDRASDGGYLLACSGLSELVRGTSTKFLSKLEQNIRILDPAKTELVDDLSDGYMASQLYIDTAVLRKYSASNLNKLREETFEQFPQLEQAWLSEFEESEGMQSFLNAQVNYPQLAGQKANLY